MRQMKCIGLCPDSCAVYELSIGSVGLINGVQDPRRHPSNDGHRRNIVGDDGAGSHHRPRTDSDSGKDDGTCPDPRTVIDVHRLGKL